MTQINFDIPTSSDGLNSYANNVFVELIRANCFPYGQFALYRSDAKLTLGDCIARMYEFEVVCWATGFQEWTIIAMSLTKQTCFRMQLGGIGIDDPLADAGSIHFAVYGISRKCVEDRIAWIRELIPEDLEEAEGSRVKVHFWYHTPNGYSSFSRDIEAPSWADIAENYVGRTHSNINHLMQAQPDELNGNIILWMGEPGTGKTYAIRALSRAWRQSAKFIYITDPEAFLMDPAYMMTVLSSNDSSPWQVFEDEAGAKSNLIVFEDAGELLHRDAKDRTGQGFSRLLNLTDGILGQGLKMKILITTNEQEDDLHPAIMRQGRCADLCHFERFDTLQAEEWLNRYDHTLTDGNTSSYQLADLYTMINDNRSLIDMEERTIGFK